MPIITLLFLSPFNSTLLCHASQMPVYFYPPYCDDHLYGHRIFESVEMVREVKDPAILEPANKGPDSSFPAARGVNSV